MSAPRPASKSPFPYGWPGQVCYFEMAAGAPHQVKTRDEMRALVRRALDGHTLIYATWPGQWRTDLFVIDDVVALAEAIGLTEKAASA